MQEFIVHLLMYKPPHLFELLFICLLFFRRSSTYDFDAYLAIGFGIFIGTMLPTLSHPTIQMFVAMLYQFGLWFLITRIIFLILSVKQLYSPSSPYGEGVMYMIESPTTLFVFVIFFSMSTRLVMKGTSINYTVLLIEHLIMWIFIGSIITTIKALFPESIIRYISGGIGTVLGLILVITSIAILFGIQLPLLFF